MKNNITIFWDFSVESFDYASSILNKLSMDHLNIFQSYKFINKKDTVRILENITFIDRDNVNKLSPNKFEPSILLLLEKYEGSIHRVVARYLKMLGYKNTINEIEAYYYISLKSIYEIISNSEILLFFDTPHHPVDYLAFLVGRVLNKSVFVTRGFAQGHSTDLPRRRYITNNFPNFDTEIIDMISNPSNINDNLLPEDLRIFKSEFSQKSNIKYNPKHLGVRWKLNKQILHILKSISQIQKQKPQFSLLTRKSKLHFRSIFLDNLINKIVLNNYSKKANNLPDFGNNYIYFPLQFQPEASTTPLGGVFANQEIIINYISDNLPYGYWLYVREHPAYWYRKSSFENVTYARNNGFYKRVSDLYNVQLISKDVNHQLLIKSSKLVISLTGTVIWEAFGFNKRSLVFGNYIYSDLKNVIQFSSDVNLPKILQNSESEENSLNNSFRSILTIIEKKTILMDNNLIDLVNGKITHSIEFDYIIEYIAQKRSEKL